MINSQAIVAPSGVSTFGSGVIRVSPDFAVIQVSVEFTEDTPKRAFDRTKAASESVRKFLNTVKDCEVNTSRVTVQERRNWQSQKSLGYNASIAYRIVLKALDKVEEVISGLIQNGANSIQSVTFQSANLKEYRKEARRLAILAAKEKAAHYCDAAGADIGSVIHIEDLNPDLLEVSLRARGVQTEGAVGDFQEDDEIEAIDPGDIRIVGAVRAVFEIIPRKQ